MRRVRYSEVAGDGRLRVSLDGKCREQLVHRHPKHRGQHRLVLRASVVGGVTYLRLAL
jgi:hypothetical protein